MSSLYKMEEWQESSGKWTCNCVTNLGKNGGHWLHPARILGLTPAEYVKYVVENYNPIVWYNKDYSLVLFSWEKQSDMRKFKNFINKKARERQYFI